MIIAICLSSFSWLKMCKLFIQQMSHLCSFWTPICKIYLVEILSSYKWFPGCNVYLILYILHKNNHLQNGIWLVHAVFFVTLHMIGNVPFVLFYKLEHLRSLVRCKICAHQIFLRNGYKLLLCVTFFIDVAMLRHYKRMIIQWCFKCLVVRDSKREKGKNGITCSNCTKF